jgi:hypothetical protein
VLVIFAIFWGLTALGFSSLWTRIISTVAAEDPILPPTLYGIYFSIRGIANLVSGPISNRLLGSSSLAGHARFAYGVGNYVRQLIADRRSLTDDIHREASSSLSGQSTLSAVRQGSLTRNQSQPPNLGVCTTRDSCNIRHRQG